MCLCIAVSSGDTSTSTAYVKSANSSSRKLESASTCSSRLDNDGAYVQDHVEHVHENGGGSGDVCLCEVCKHL